MKGYEETAEKFNLLVFDPSTNGEKLKYNLMNQKAAWKTQVKRSLHTITKNGSYSVVNSFIFNLMIYFSFVVLIVLLVLVVSSITLVIHQYLFLTFPLIYGYFHHYSNVVLYIYICYNLLYII